MICFESRVPGSIKFNRARNSSAESGKSLVGPRSILTSLICICLWTTKRSRIGPVWFALLSNTSTRAFATRCESNKACSESRTRTAENSVFGTTFRTDRKLASATGSDGDPSNVTSIDVIIRPSYASIPSANVAEQSDKRMRADKRSWKRLRPTDLRKDRRDAMPRSDRAFHTLVARPRATVQFVLCPICSKTVS